MCLSAVGNMYIECAILRNYLTCLYGNSTSQFFGLVPFTIFNKDTTKKILSTIFITMHITPI